jgi:hypothetical protein
VRLSTSSLVGGGSGKPVHASAPSVKRLAPPETPAECQQCDEGYAESHSLRLIPLYIGVYFVAVVLGWACMAVVVAAWFRPS